MKKWKYVFGGAALSFAVGIAFYASGNQGLNVSLATTAEAASGGFHSQ